MVTATAGRHHRSILTWVTIRVRPVSWGVDLAVCGSRQIEHLGSARDEAELEALKAAAQQRVAAGQLELDLGLDDGPGRPLPITSSRMSHLVDALERGYRGLGFEQTAGGHEAFRHLVLARARMTQLRP